MPAGKMEEMLIAMPRPQRQQLFNAAPTDVRRTILLLNAPQQVVSYDLLESKLLRAIESNRQLAEELDDFWFNHFNVFYEKGADRFLIPEYERDVIRPNVLGKFRDLLEATAKSPAMLFYLDNFQSVRPDLDANNKNRKVKRGLNENYGRELMELHTLGVNGGYTQKDVTEVARCFTGWTILEPRKGGGFFYQRQAARQGREGCARPRDPAGGGMDDGEKVLDILATHPSTAHFISKELAQRFVADNPPDALVEKMAQTFLATGRRHPRSDEDHAGLRRNSGRRARIGPKLKTPFEMVASSVRALGADVTDAWALANQVGQSGRAAVSQAGADRIFEPECGMGELGRAAQSDEFRAATCSEWSIRASRWTRASSGDNPEMVAKTLMYRNASPQTRAAIDKALLDQKQKTPGAGGRSGDRFAGFSKRGNYEFQTHFSQEFRAGDLRRGRDPGCGCRDPFMPRMLPALAARKSWSPSSSAAQWMVSTWWCRTASSAITNFVRRSRSRKPDGTRTCRRRSGRLLRPASVARPAQADVRCAASGHRAMPSARPIPRARTSTRRTTWSPARPG